MLAVGQPPPKYISALFGSLLVQNGAEWGLIRNDQHSEVDLQGTLPCFVCLENVVGNSMSTANLEKAIELSADQNCASLSLRY